MGHIHDIYSIEHKSTLIYERHTREYFAEVLSSYTTGNYRSAVVMLWSVAICDILLKLTELAEMHSDSVAASIIKTVKDAQAANPTSSEWESKLINDVFSKTQLLEPADKLHLENLHKERHLAAHPVLSAELELHRPNHETVRSLIRNTLDGLLIKPPFFAKNILDNLLKDITKSYSQLSDESEFINYISNKYFKSFNTSTAF